MRALLLQGLAAGDMHLIELESTNIEAATRVSVAAALRADKRNNAVLERVVGRLSLEPAVTSARWRVNGGAPSWTPRPTCAKSADPLCALALSPRSCCWRSARNLGRGRPSHCQSCAGADLCPYRLRPAELRRLTPVVSALADENFAGKPAAGTGLAYPLYKKPAENYLQNTLNCLRIGGIAFVALNVSLHVPGQHQRNVVPKLPQLARQ